MDEIKKRIDDMFRGLARTVEAKRLHAEILANAQQRYEGLLAQGIAPEEAVRLVVEDLGTEEELRESLPVNGKPLGIASLCCGAFLVLSLGYFAVYRWRLAELTWKYFRAEFALLLHLLFLPAFFFAVGFFACMLLQRLSAGGRAGKAVRWHKKAFWLSIVLVALYVVVGLAWLGGAPFPRSMVYIYNFIYKNGYIFFIPGCLLYFGCKR